MTNKNILTLEEMHPKEEFLPIQIVSSNGVLLCSKSDMAKIMGVTPRSIESWTKKGCEVSPLSSEKLNLYDILYVKRWHSENIDRKKAKGRSNPIKELNIDTGGEDDDEDYSKLTLHQKLNIVESKIQPNNDEEESDRLSKLIKTILDSIKAQKEIGELIPKSDTEKTITEQVSVMIATFRNAIKTLPRDLEDSSRDEVAQELEHHFKFSIEKLSKLSKIKNNSDMRIYDILQMIVDLIVSKEIGLDEIASTLEVCSE